MKKYECATHRNPEEIVSPNRGLGGAEFSASLNFTGICSPAIKWNFDQVRI